MRRIVCHRDRDGGADDMTKRMPLEEYNSRRYELAARGNDLPHAKLNPDAVREIRSNPKGLNGRQLAEQYGVSEACIRKVLYRESWSHVI